mmetsp:Transcript_8514/g.17258  ORF Transcript_8514/g.17258 Transcript_8514/m.17258 type:complete len:140 (-) Transcript_8514:43-462(-)
MRERFLLARFMFTDPAPSSCNVCVTRPRTPKMLVAIGHAHPDRMHLGPDLASHPALHCLSATNSPVAAAADMHAHTENLSCNARTAPIHVHQSHIVVGTWTTPGTLNQSITQSPTHSINQMVVTGDPSPSLETGVAAEI